MINISPLGTKVSLEFHFTELNIGIGFPCSIFLSISSNCGVEQSLPVAFDHNNQAPFPMEEKIRTSVVLYPQKNLPIEMSLIVRTEKGEKPAGKLKFDVHSAIVSNQLSWCKMLEECPDSKANLSFTLKWAQIKNESANKGQTGGNYQNTSFNSAFDSSMNSNQIMTVKKDIREGSPFGHKNRSPSPNTVKISFGQGQNISEQKIKTFSENSIQTKTADMPTNNVLSKNELGSMTSNQKVDFKPQPFVPPQTDVRVTSTQNMSGKKANVFYQPEIQNQTIFQTQIYGTKSEVDANNYNFGEKSQHSIAETSQNKSKVKIFDDDKKNDSVLRSGSANKIVTTNISTKPVIGQQVIQNSNPRITIPSNQGEQRQVNVQSQPINSVEISQKKLVVQTEAIQTKNMQKDFVEASYRPMTNNIEQPSTQQKERLLLKNENVQVNYNQSMTSVQRGEQDSQKQKLIDIISSKNSQIEELQQKLIEQLQRNEENEKSINELMNENKEIHQLKEIEIKDLSSENLRIKDKLMQVNARKIEEGKLQQVEKERNEFKRKFELFEVALAQKEDQIMDLKETNFDLRLKEQELIEITEKLTQAESKFTEAGNELENLKTENNALTEEISYKQEETARIERVLFENSEKMAKMRKDFEFEELEMEKRIAQKDEALKLKNQEIENLSSKKVITNENYQKMIDFQQKLEATIDENSRSIKEKVNIIRIKDLEIEEFKRDKESLEVDLEKKTVRGRQLKTTIEELETENNKLQGKVLELQKMNNESLNTSNLMFSKNLEETKVTVETLNAELGRLKEELKTKNSLIKKLKDDHIANESKMENFKREKTTGSTLELEKLRTQIANHLQIIDKYEQNMIEKENKIGDLENQIEELLSRESKIENAKNHSKEIQTLESQLRQKDILIKSYQKKFESGNYQNFEELKTLRATVDDLNRKLEAAKMKNSVSQSESLTVQKFEEKNREIETLKNQNSTNEKRIIDFEAEITDFEYNLHMQKATIVKVKL